MQVLKPIWTKEPETANRVRSRMEAVLDWAKVSGFQNVENPAAGVGTWTISCLPELRKEAKGLMQR